jgi:hypothetical protein
MSKNVIIAKTYKYQSTTAKYMRMPWQISQVLQHKPISQMALVQLSVAEAVLMP